jgi:myo-inositol-1(or 4)-monophosphatase
LRLGWAQLGCHSIRPMAQKSATSRVLDADWLGLCRRSVETLREMLVLHPTTADRAAGTGRGAGGDESLVIDRQAEDVVFDGLETLFAQGHSFTAISEERGEVVFGDGTSDVRVVIDPIDGSLNAKRMIPTCALSVAVASGERMEDVRIGYVFDFGNEEEYVARLREGAQVNGVPLDPDQLGRGLEIVGLEAARPEWISPVAARLEGEVHRIRIIGTIALSLCYVAASRFDGMATTNVCRSVDAAAAQLIAREAGAFVSVLGHGGLEAPLDIDARFRLAAARTPEGLETLVHALTSAGIPNG